MVITRLKDPPPYEHFYVATRLDIDLYHEVWKGNDVFHGGISSILLWAALITIDLPISVISDTFCLPYDVIKYINLDTPPSSRITRFTVNSFAGNWVLLDRKPVPICIVEAPAFEKEHPLISSLTKEINGLLGESFTLLVSAKPFHNSQRLTIRKMDHDGIRYYSDSVGQEFWLSRELFRQYRSEPEEIYLGIEAVTAKPSEKLSK